MFDPNRVTKADMSLQQNLWTYRTPAQIPLRFDLGDERVFGIPEAYHPTVIRRISDAAQTRYVISGEKNGLEIRAEYSEYHDYPVTEWVFYFTNRGTADTPILSDIRVTGTLPGNRASIEHGNGDTCGRDGYSWKIEDVDRLISFGTQDGTSCNGAFPYMRLLTQDGFGYNIAFGWTGSWNAELSPADGDTATLLEVGQWRCHMKIRPGETMRTPAVTVMAYSGEESRGRNLWRRWYLRHILPRENGQPLPPKLCLHTFCIGGKEEFCGTTEENQIFGISEYLRRGLHPDIWWIDAGWYACDNSWWKINDWRPNPENWPNGMGAVGKLCDENDIRFLLWFEPERCHEGSDIEKEHPEWLLYYTEPDGTPSTERSFNLGIDEARQWLTDRVCALIADSHIRVYRQDFNYNPMKAWAQNEDADRIGALENLHIQGYLRYWDDILARNPGLWIDSCASGGRRNDLDTMRRAVPLHYTDVGYGEHPMKQKQHRQMFEWIPYFRAHTMSHDDNDGNYLTGGKQPIDAFCYHNAFTPAMTSMIEYNDSDELFDLGRRMDPIWRRAAELELRGDFYPLTECRLDPKDDYAVQFEDPANNDGFVQIIRNTQAIGDSVTVHPMVTDGAVYHLEDPEHGNKLTLTAEQFSDFTLTMPKRSGMIWFYHKEA